MSTVARLEDHYVFLEDLAKGGEGEVKKYYRKDTGALFAVKFRKRKDRGCPREVEILRSFPKNRLIVAFVECFDIDSKNCAVVLEYCPGGDLHGFFRSQEQSDTKFAFSERFMWSVFKQLADALSYIHNYRCGKRRVQTVIHCDIKPNNVLIKNLGTRGDFSSISIRLADFGFARFYNPKDTHQSLFGSSAYFPPEMDWQEPKYTPALDIWGMGAVMHFLAHGYPPLEDPEIAAKRETGGNSGASGVDKANFLSRGYSESDWHNLNTQRVVVPINLEQDDQTTDSRTKRPSPRYSDTLNECFSMPLTMDAKTRPDASVIAKKVKKLRPSWWRSERLARLKCLRTEEKARRNSSKSRSLVQ